MGKKCKAIITVAALILLILVIVCGVYVSDYYPANDEAVSAMADAVDITVSQQENALVFSPESPAAGFIFYPGGKVEYTAYTPLMAALAQQDMLCILVEMPCNLAVLNMDAAAEFPEQFPEIDHWYIGGHSLGGSMAASFAAENTETIEGLVLLASYSTADLTGSNLGVLSLYGDQDGVLNMEKYESNRDNFPSDTTETVIAGGNHAGFGRYGPQEGDGVAAITAQQQISITADLLVEWIMN